VNDLKQFEYCPRIVFYQYLMPVARKTTFKMEEGRRAETSIDELEKRRTLQRYGLAEGTRHFHVSLRSERLGLSGKLDLLIEGSEGLFPVDFKFSSGRPRRNHVYQLCGYALLLEETYGRVVRQGFIYMIPKKEVTALELTDQLKNETLVMLEAMREMIHVERMPNPTPVRARCDECEYRNYCADVF
jgi:CRISPR-associated exonuclease Cas4